MKQKLNELLPLPFNGPRLRYWRWYITCPKCKRPEKRETENHGSG